MTTLFGIPMSTLTVVLTVAFAAALGAVALLAVRNRVFFRLGTRNLARRRSRTLLILVGLMLGTALMSAALNTGDTLSHTVRVIATTALGKTDELIAVKGTPKSPGPGVIVEYFDQSKFTQVRAITDQAGGTNGVAPAIFEAVAVQDSTSRQTEAQVTVFASDPENLAGFGSMSRASGGGTVSLADLAPGEVYVNSKAVDKFGAKAGDELQVFAAGKLTQMKVRDVVDYDGTGTDGAALLMPLPEAQSLLGKPDQINYILVANHGGVGATDSVISKLAPQLDGLGLQISPTKQDALKEADQIGNSMMTTFTTFGTFSVVAGILLIFLIFVMLAAERKTEMGIARAVGTQRENLVQMFLFEGAVYDLAAAAVGAAFGIAVAYAMVIVMSSALASFGIDLQHTVRWQSLAVAYTIGVLLTLIVVTVSAWQVSVLNIVRAIRSLPEPVLPHTRGRRRFILPFVAWAFGALLIYSGLSAQQAAPFDLGVAVAMMGFIPFLRALGAGDRLAYSLPALGITIWFLLPFFIIGAITPPLAKDFTIFVLGGLLVVTGATWLTMYNSDLILRAAMAVFGRVRWLAPVVKTAIAYPLTSRFRTGITFAMFTLIVFTLVTMATIITSVNQVIDDYEPFAGGYDIRAATAPISPIDDLGAAIQSNPSLNASDVKSVASGSALVLGVRQAGAGGDFKDYVVRGMDDTFLQNNTYDLALMSPQYKNAHEVWGAVESNPNLAVVDAYIVPHRTNYNAALGGYEFQLSGFYFEDGNLPPTQIEVNDPQTGTIRTLTVIGVLHETASPLVTLGITTSQRSAEAAYGDRARPTMHYLQLAPGADAKATAKSLESAFLANGMQATATQSDLNDMMGTQHAFTYILEGFMGLGLLVGVAALGVISARSVVERKQEIGVLRSLGFQREMVQLAFLLESSFIALLGITVGTALALIVSFNVILDMRDTPGWESLAFGVPGRASRSCSRSCTSVRSSQPCSRLDRPLARPLPPPSGTNKRAPSCPIIDHAL